MARSALATCVALVAIVASTAALSACGSKPAEEKASSGRAADADAPAKGRPASEIDGALPQPGVSAWVFEKVGSEGIPVLSAWAQNFADYNAREPVSDANRIRRLYVWGGSIMSPPEGSDCPAGVPMCLNYFDATEPTVAKLRELVPDADVSVIVDTPTAADAAHITALGDADAEAVASNIADGICAADIDGLVFGLEPLNLQGGQLSLYSAAAKRFAASGCATSDPPLPVGIFGSASKVNQQLDAAGSLGDIGNAYFELSMYDLSPDGTLAGYEKALTTIFAGELPNVIERGIPFALALPAAGSASEHECLGTVDATSPPPYYDVAACEAEITGMDTNWQIDYIGSFIDIMEQQGSQVAAAKGFLGYSLYTWSYPLGNANWPMPNVPPPYNGSQKEDVVSCLKQGLAFPSAGAPSPGGGGACEAP